MSSIYSLAIHGGSGTILKSRMNPELEEKYIKGLEEAIQKGKDVLAAHGTATEAVCASVASLEDCPMYNAGKGSVYSAEGIQEMDASIMRGIDLQAGAVAMLKGIRNPILLAKQVMEKSEHVLLAGDGALAFAKEQGFLEEAPEYFHDEFRYNQWLAIRGSDKIALDHSYLKDEKFGTVGAVALDVHGNLAAATSTGGMTNKKFGRIGDSPLIGAGTFASNNTCAVSCTGSGEYFIRAVAAYDVHCLMEYKGLSLQAACKELIHKRMPKLGGDGGLIAVDAKGNLALTFNTEGMYRAYLDGDKVITEIYK